LAKRNSPLRPRCVDIAPSRFGSQPFATNAQSSSSSRKVQSGKLGTLVSDLLGGAQSNRTNNSRTNNSRTNSTYRSQHGKASSSRRTNATASTQSAGAVRRSADTHADGSSHVGKVAVAAVAICGALIYTTGASEELMSSTTESPKLTERTIASPAFYFDDKADALDRNLAMVSPANNLGSIAQGESESKTHIDAAGNSDAPPVDAPTGLFGNADSQRPSFSETLALAIQSRDGTLFDANSGLDNATTASLPAEPLPPSNTQHVLTLASGDNLSSLLSRNGLSTEQMRALVTDELVIEHLSNLPEGQKIKLTRTPDGLFNSLTTRLGKDVRVNINQADAGFDVEVIDLPTERRRVVTSGEITQSLYLAAEQANLKQSTIMELANIFQWELDFARDIRDGDRFSLVYDKLYREGEYIGDGDILAAEFVRGGKSHEAIRFTTSDGNSDYYAADGKSKRRTFMRHPVDVVRITSKFNPKRMHPVLHQLRAHRGVDYGSPHGSPIYATADGTVSFSGDKNAYGNTVVLKHGERFSTLYAHMDRIASKSKKGSKVKQGDVIGYVGNTGRVTGTHLHYEFRVNGIQIDPLKVELPAAEPLATQYLPDLQALHAEMSSLMNAEKRSKREQVASLPVPIKLEDQ